MSQANNSYLLPNRTALARGDDTFDPKRFKLQVQDLPMGSVGQVAQTVKHLLMQMNAASIPVSNRVANMALLLQPLLFTLSTLNKGFSREPLPLSKRATVISELHEQLCILGVQGYKVILDQYHHESLAGQLLHKSNRVLALHHALYFLGQSLLKAYQLYRPAPEHIWREIHGIHRYAFDQKLADRPVDNEEQGLLAQSSVNDLYKQLLLLSLSDPYRLMHGEVQRVYYAVLRWVVHSQLLDLGKTEKDAGQFIVDISVDEPPRLRGAERDHQILKGWVLDTSKLAVRLADDLETSEAPHGVMRPQVSPDKISPDLMARLMLTWGIGSKRVTDRDETPGEVALICGLEAIYQAIGGEQVPELANKPGAFNAVSKTEKVEKKSRGVGVPRVLLEADERVINDDPDLDNIRNWITQSNEPALQLPDQPPVPKAEVVAPGESERVSMARTCLVYNESVNGYHLGWITGSDEQITVGELVAVSGQDGHDAELLRLGVIRWMRVEHPDVIDFGVELLPGDITPIIFVRQWGRNKQTGHWPGLLQQSPNEDTTLITAPFYSEEKEQTWLIKQDDRRKVFLTRVIEATASFIQIYYQYPEAKAVQIATQVEFAEEDFDQLWTSL